MGCGVCVSVCPEGAISLVRDPEICEPLEIQRLISDAQMPQSVQKTLLPLSHIESQ
jgi:ferredoxin